jgi:Xaa-Pro dipeptidase
MRTETYRDHVQTLRASAERAVEASGFDSLVIGSGVPLHYFADDQDAPFHPTPHFARWTPLAGPHHLLHLRPGAKPELIRVAPEDYWYEQAKLGNPFWASEFEVREVGSAEDAWKALGELGRAAYVGDEGKLARSHGFSGDRIQPRALVSRLDWDRSIKTAWEVECIEEAERLAVRGHLAARAAFEGGASELETHHVYVTAVGCTDAELPYPTIVCHDEKAAILHYTGKRGKTNGRVLLIDAGAACHGYASDITRTWTSKGCDPTFRDLVHGMDELQQELCDAVRPGRRYLDLHIEAHTRIAELLRSIGVLRAPAEEACEQGLTRPFFPHGLGHFLGLQVHDVAGHQKSPSGGKVAPPAEHPYLRTTRTIEEGQVFTIEPGVYFIDMLLREHRSGPTAKHFDWKLVDRLAPFGGVRIEDNVLVTSDGHKNLTRAQFPA